MSSPPRRIACFATQGSGSADERRIVELLATLEPVVLAFDRGARLRMPIRLVLELRRCRPTVVVMEGTGVAGGLSVMAARRLFGIPYVVSSGDAVAPFVALERPWLAPLAQLYERLLYSHADGVIGWSPYIVGRAVSLGARRAATAANWADRTAAAGARSTVRAQLGISDDAIVFGLVGSLQLTRRLDWCYGAELVKALRETDRDDIRVLIVGDGSGRARLAELAGSDLGVRVLLPGRCSPDEVMDYLAAMDVASLPQTRDAVGALRYTTKLSEYVAACLPVVTGQLPLAYDIGEGWMWRLPGALPWSVEYVRALAELMRTVSSTDIAARRSHVPRGLGIFDRESQRRRVTALLEDVMADSSASQDRS